MNILPYIELEEESFQGKCCGFYALGSIILLFYSEKFISFESALFFWILSPLMACTLEVSTLHERYSRREILLILGTIAGSLFIIRPPVLDLRDSTLENSFIDQLLGFIFSMTSGFLLARLLVTLKKLREVHYATMTHIISIILMLFLPIFFPMQGLHPPGLYDWVAIIIISLVSLIAILMIIKAF